MKPYVVDVIARFDPELGLLDAVFNEMPSKASGSPDFGELAEQVNVDIGTTSNPTSPTLTVSYPAGGQDADEASRYAVALFERDRDRHSLPEPPTLTTEVHDGARSAVTEAGPTAELARRARPVTSPRRRGVRCRSSRRTLERRPSR
jgi:hypothetical protein